MRTITMFIITIILIVISLALILGLSLAIGWGLTFLLPLSLFEGALLSMIAGIACSLIWYAIIRALLLVKPEEEFEWEDDDDFEIDEIPEERFWKTSGERTWENVYRYLLANSIYVDIVDSPRWMGGMGEKQQQELAIRLADAALGVLKPAARKSKKSLSLTKDMLKQQLIRDGQRPYEDDLLDMAAAAVNNELPLLEKNLQDISRKKLWDAQAEEYWPPIPF